MVSPRMDPPEPVEIPDEPIEMELAHGVCRECDDEFGPTFSEDIGYWLHIDHPECRDIDTEIWTETWEIQEDGSPVTIASTRDD